MIDLVGQAQVEDGLEVHPLIGRHRGIANDGVKARCRAEPAFDADPQLSVRLARRQLDPQRDAVSRAVEHHVGDVETRPPESRRAIGGQEAEIAAVFIGGCDRKNLVADSRPPSFSCARFKIACGPCGVGRRPGRRRQQCDAEIVQVVRGGRAGRFDIEQQARHIGAE